MFGKLNIKGFTKSVKGKTQQVITEIVKKKTSGGCKSCGKNK